MLKFHYRFANFGHIVSWNRSSGFLKICHLVWWNSTPWLPILAIWYVEILLLRCHCWLFLRWNSFCALRNEATLCAVLLGCHYLPSRTLKFYFWFVSSSCFVFWNSILEFYFLYWNLIFALPMLAIMFVQVLFVCWPCWPICLLKFYMWVEIVSHFVWWNSICSLPSLAVLYIET